MNKTPFKTASELTSCIKALNEAGAEVYEVGGPVRDHLLQRAVKDHDLLCRKLSMRQICSLLAPLGKVATVGKSFGVIKFSPHRSPETEIDIALPRKEISTGAGHRDFEVSFDPELPVEEDLGRRDFTINAMAVSLADGKLIDPFGGKNDLEKRVLRQVFPRAFEEDPLRLVRAVQFTARFGLIIEDETLSAMKAHAELITTVSGERIIQELAKLLTAPKPSVGFVLMQKCGLLKFILPELDALVGLEQDKQPGDDVFAHTMRVLDASRNDSEIENKGDMELMLAALLHDIGKHKTIRFHEPSNRIVFFSHQVVSAKMAKRWLQKMKTQTLGIDLNTIIKLIDNHMFETKAHYTERAIRRFVAKVGQDTIFKLLDLRLADNRGGKHPNGIKGVLRLRSKVREELAKKPPFGPKDLAINGEDIMEMQVPEGRLIGFILNALVEKVLDNPEQNTRETLLALVKEIIQNQNK